MQSEGTLTNPDYRAAVRVIRERDAPPNRIRSLQDQKNEERKESLIALATHGLSPMLVEGRFAHTSRANENGLARPEGENLRYDAIVALGCTHLQEAAQKQIFHGMTASEFACGLIGRARESQDTGAAALVAWAAAEVAGFCALDIFERLRISLSERHPLPTVECSWILCAALAARRLADVDDICLSAAERLKSTQGQAGLFSHMIPRRAAGWSRAHVGCFADQVYPIQALARFSVAWHDQQALDAANACAKRICALQGPNGQWWWHYDIRNGTVVEGYPVYSVHQHAMGPMALLDLLEAGGEDFTPSIVKGIEWLYTHPEISPELISVEQGVVWRKVCRKEPNKAVRKISALATAIWPGAGLSVLTWLFPATKIDYECRPYEFGWLLYAWLSGGAVSNLTEGAAPDLARHGAGSKPVQPQRPLFGFNLDALCMSEVISRCKEAIEERSSLLLGVVNAAKIVKARKDPLLRASLLECDLLLADGQSVVWASRLFGQPLPERVAGIDIFENLLNLAHRERLSVYLLGARPDVLRALQARLKRDFPDLKVAGCRDGYFPDGDGAKIAEEIRGSGAHMLFLGMSSPKKEKFLASFRDTLNVPILHGVGGSFDIMAGVTRRAPLSWQRLGMEWAYRLMQEPRRMWWRYLSTNVGFLALLALEAFNPSLPSHSNRAGTGLRHLGG
jgi:exopolysaccharide biosynthesis WecB/TagA/CpsF family protein